MTVAEQFTSAFRGMNWALTALLVSATALVADPEPADPLPLGHPDFRPSDQQPIGFRGDGNGCFPAARPVREWWDGKPVNKTIAVHTRSRLRSAFAWCMENDEPKNVLWKTALPGWSDAQPIVAGDRVFALCEPHFLVCIDLRSGTNIWQREILPLELDGMDTEEAKAKQDIINIARAIELLLQTLDDEPSGQLRSVFHRLDELEEQVDNIDPDPEFAKAFEELDDMLRAWKKGRRENKPHGVPTMCNPLAPAVERAYKVPVNLFWYGYVGFAASTPVSDGKHVYAVLPQGQVACYDLAGNRVWGHRFREWEPLTAHHLPSPLLCGNVLMVRNLTGDVVGMDKLTGRILWSPDIGEGGNRGSYLNHKLMHIAIPGSEPLDLLVTNKRKILRVSDGTVLGEFPFANWNNGRGPSIVGRQGMFFAAQSYDGPPSPCRAFRITTPASAGETGTVLRVEEAFQLESPHGAAPGPFGNECIVLADRFITSYGDTWATDDGTMLGRLSDSRLNRGGGPVLAGTRVIYPGGGPGQSPNGRAREDGFALAAFQVVDLSNPATPRLISAHNVLGGPDLPNDIFADRYLADFDKERMLGCYRGIASWFGCRNGGVTPHGELLLVQSATHLYCIGPALNGTPDDNPDVVKAIQRTRSHDKLLQLLPSHSAQYRHEALKRLFDLEVSIPSDTLLTLATDDPYEEIRALAVAGLDRTNPETRPGWALVHKLLIDPMTDLRPHRAQQTHFRQDWVCNTLLAMGTNAVSRLIAEVQPGPHSDPRIRLGALSALRRMNSVNRTTRELCFSLVTGDKQPALRLLATRWLTESWPNDPRTIKTMRGLVLKDRDIQEPAFRFLAGALEGIERTSFLRLFGMAVASAPDNLRVAALRAALTADPPIDGLVDQIIALAGMEDAAAVTVLTTLEPQSEAVAAIGRLLTDRRDDYFTARICGAALRLADKGDISALRPLLLPLVTGRWSGSTAAAAIITSGEGKEVGITLARLRKLAAALPPDDVGRVLQLLNALARAPGLKTAGQRAASAEILAMLLEKGNLNTKRQTVAILAALKTDAAVAVEALRDAARQEAELGPAVKAAVEVIR